MEYDDQDAAEEMYLDGLFLDFRAERGQEIADDLDYAEFISSIISAHDVCQADVDHVCCVAEERLRSGALEEAVFQAARAFETYVISVLIDPVRTVIASRIDRALPDGFSAKPKTILVSIRGLGPAAMPFVSYAISLLAADPAASQSQADRLKAFVDATESPWKRLRNGLFHSVLSVSLADASAFVSEVRELLSWFNTESMRVIETLRKEREQSEVAAERIEPITFLAQLHQLDASAMVQWHAVSVNTARARIGLDRGLGSLLADGLIEEVKSDRFEHHIRITEIGLTFYLERVKPILPEQSVKLASYEAVRALERQAEQRRLFGDDA